MDARYVTELSAERQDGLDVQMGQLKAVDRWGSPASHPMHQDGMLVDYEVVSDSLAVVRQLGAEIQFPAT